MTDEITELVELLREALFQQPDAVEGWHAPWVSDAATPPGLIQVDGDLDLNILASALSGWVRQQQAGAWREGAETVYEDWSEMEGPFLTDVTDTFPNPYDGADT